MRREEMLASFFVHDDEGWRLRGHAKAPFFRWLASWAMALKTPADIGFDGSAYNLPPLLIRDEIVSTEWRRPGELFAGQLKGIFDRINVRRQSVDDRVKAAAGIVDRAEGQVIVWCGLNDESHAITRAIPGAVEVHGSDSQEQKITAIESFLSGAVRVLVTKPKICGFGMNFQNAATMVFLGMNDSYESYYQCIRRCWRYGQRSAVTAHIVVTDHETEIVSNVRRKEKEAEAMTQEIIAAAREYEMAELGTKQETTEEITRDVYQGDGWTVYQGDCVQEMRERIADESVDLSVFSPPFISLYTYSATSRDIGNCRSSDEFFAHFGYCIG